MKVDSEDTKPTQVVEQVQQVIRETEEIFEEIASMFPRLASEIRKSREGSEEQINRFTATGSLLEKSGEVIEGASRAFMELHKKDDVLLSTLRSDLEEVKALDSRILEIRESSEQMELISLNAMTVAIKAGKAGGAFSYITEELKRISARSIQYTEELTREGSELDTLFRDLLSSMENIETIQGELFHNFGSLVQKGFAEAARATDSTITFLKKINQESGEIEPPLVTMMEEVQQQDIIRQSLDHVLVALSELKEISIHDTKKNSAELLDELSFLTSIPGLCSDLIDEVQQQIGGSVHVFRENLDRIDRGMMDLESRLGHYRRENPVGSYFTDAGTAMNRISSDVANSLSMKGSIMQESGELMSMVTELQESFVDFAELVTQFQNVNVASRIEIAKQEALASMEATVGEMSELTLGIGTTVEQALLGIKRFFKQTRDSIQMYSTVYEKELRFSRDFDMQMQGLSRESKELLQSLEQIIAGFTAFREGFHRTWRDTNYTLEKLEGCSSRLQECKGLLSRIETVFRNQFQEELQRKGESEAWTIRNHRLQEIIERFTILEHKQKAGKIGGFAVEEGNDSGDVTFF